MKQAYRNIASKVRIPGWEDPAADILRMVHDWLCDETNGRWLMILDNADDAGVFSSAGDGAAPLESFLPVSSNGWILVTSRNQQSALDLVGVDQAKRNVLEVEPMQESDALLLLKSRTTVDAAVEDDAKTLVRVLEYIPLAITHAAAFLTVKSHSYTLRAYLRIFGESEPKQKALLKSKTPRDTRRDHSVSNAVLITWQMSFEQIRETDPEAADLLCLMAMFDNQAIPGLIICENREPLVFWEVAQPFIDFSLIKVQNTGHLDQAVEERLFDMHSLVQLATRNWLEVRERQGKELYKWERKSVHIMATTFPDVDSNDQKTMKNCHSLLPHASRTLEYSPKGRNASLDRATIADKVGWYLQRSGQYAKAEGLCEDAYVARNSLLGPNNMDRSRVWNLFRWYSHVKGNCTGHDRCKKRR